MAGLSGSNMAEWTEAAAKFSGMVLGTQTL